MGGGTYDPSAYASYASTIKHTTHHSAVFKSTALNAALDPKGVRVRESRDSADSPSATPLIVALDVTGSMGMIAHTLAKDGIGTLFTEVLDRKPISDPHMMFMALGDANCDRVPLQVSQFEADNRVIEQLTMLYVEGGGGGNGFESYNLPWYFAGMHTSHDAFEKRNKKGYLFTVGDEEFPNDLTPAQIKEFIGDDVEEGSLSNAALIAAAQRMYHVFHIVVEEGSHCHHHGKDRVYESWRASPLGAQHILPLTDHTKLAEVVVSAMQVVEGADVDKVTKSWSGGTSLVVGKAIGGLVKGGAGGKAGAAVRRF